jgi:hypothetical protein
MATTTKAKSNIPSSWHARREKSTRRSQVGPSIKNSDLRKTDILLGRGLSRFKHPGNVAYRALIDSRLECYFNGDRTVKSGVVLDIVRELKSNDCRFLQKDKGGAWQEVDLRVAREKVGHSIRDTFKMEGRFDFQDKMVQIFDHTAQFGQIFDYIVDNYAMIVLELSRRGGFINKQKSALPEKNALECAFPEEGTVPKTMSEKEDDSLMSTGSDCSDDNVSDILQDDSRHQERHENTPSPMTSSTRDSLVRNFISRLNEEAKQLEQLDNLDYQRDTTVTLFLTSMASRIEDWIDLDTVCSEGPDDDWLHVRVATTCSTTWSTTPSTSSGILEEDIGYSSDNWLQGALL